jgi:cysteinyl-tRNA synthetase
MHLDDAKQSLKSLYTALSNVPLKDVVTVDWNEHHAQRFKAAMDDDFNTPEAMAVLFDLSKQVNIAKSADTASQLKALGGVLGLLQQHPQDFLQGIPPKHYVLALEAGHYKFQGGETKLAVTQNGLSKSVDQYIEDRAAAKKAKNYAESDRIRKELLDAGIVLEDSATGTTWRRV